MERSKPLVKGRLESSLAIWKSESPRDRAKSHCPSGMAVPEHRLTQPDDMCLVLDRPPGSPDEGTATLDPGHHAEARRESRCRPREYLQGNPGPPQTRYGFRVRRSPIPRIQGKNPSYPFNRDAPVVKFPPSRVPVVNASSVPQRSPLFCVFPCSKLVIIRHMAYRFLIQP